MNILLIGGSDSLINSLINKLNKEGHRIYLLTGNAYKKEHYQKVFETYYFSYGSTSLGDVFDSVNPDVTVFMGIYDGNFKWVDDERESVLFSSSLMNLLMAYATVNRGRFIFLSSDAVFEGSCNEALQETDVTTPKSLRSMALCQAEQMCESYRRTRNLDVITVRLDHLYNLPMERKEVKDLCTQMCLDALDSGTITIAPDSVNGFLFESDAVEYLYQLIICREHKESLYHIANSQTVTHMELAECIKKYMEESEGKHEEKIPVQIVAKEDALPRKCVLSNKRYNNEFGMERFCSLEQTLEKIITYMKKNKEVFLTGEKRKQPLWKRIQEKTSWFIRAMIPFIENFICFIPFFMLNNRAVGSEYFANMDFYLLYVLLFAIIYGQQQSMVSAVLATAGYCFRQMYARSGFDVLLDYNTYVWIAQLFILGLVVGYMRDQIKIMQREAAEHSDYLEAQLSDIQDINKSNVRVKDALEVQIVNQNDSIGKLYSITSQLDQYTPEEVLFYAADLLAQMLGTKDVAIYTVSNDTYARLSAATSEKARVLGYSMRYRETELMYEEISQHKVYINRTMDANYPLMANAIFEEEEMEIIIMAWGLPWERMTLGEANFLTVVSYLIQNALLRAKRYLAVLEDTRYINGTKIMEPEAFRGLVHAYMKAEKKNLTECILLKIDTKEKDKNMVGQTLAGKLRGSDYIGIMEDGDLYALLTNTRGEDAPIVIERFRQAGYLSEIIGRQ